MGEICTISNCNKFYIFYSDEQRDARRKKGLRDLKGNDSYNMEEVVMPLQQFLNEPLTWDIVHNGATFQVLFLVVLPLSCWLLLIIFVTSI